MERMTDYSIPESGVKYRLTHREACTYGGRYSDDEIYFLLSRNDGTSCPFFDVHLISNDKCVSTSDCMWKRELSSGYFDIILLGGE